MGALMLDAVTQVLYALMIGCFIVAVVGVIKIYEKIKEWKSIGEESYYD